MRFWICVAFLAIAGCGRSVAKKEEPVPLDKVPEVAMKAAEKAMHERFPDVTFQSATLRSTGVYEITGKTKTGKVHDVEVTATGEITEVE
jgi:hypothetical protein